VKHSLAEGGRELFFTLEEYQQRLQCVRAEMRRRNLDALLVHTPENILYLTGYRTPGYYMYQCLLIDANNNPALLIRNGEIGNAQAYSWVGDCFTYLDREDPVEATIEAIADRGWQGRIGLEMRSWFLTARAYEDLTKTKSSIDWIDASGTVEQCRLIKSEQEVEYMRQAARAAEAGMRAAIEASREGATDNDISAALHFAMIEAGSEYTAMGPFVASGKRATLMHGIWGRYKVERGNTINLEIGASIHRYGAALMRAVSIGPPSHEVRTISNAAEAANRRLIESIRPGAMTADLYPLVAEEITKHGGPPPPKAQRWGYSIGLAFPPDWGEGHILSMNEVPNVRLEAGMTFHLPYCIRTPRCSAAFSETVLVTETGHEVLTKFDRELFIR
jgi:Xaa-Pro dipeptidase